MLVQVLRVLRKIVAHNNSFEIDLFKLFFQDHLKRDFAESAQAVFRLLRKIAPRTQSTLFESYHFHKYNL